MRMYIIWPGIIIQWQFLTIKILNVLGIIDPGFNRIHDRVDDYDVWLLKEILCRLEMLFRRQANLKICVRNEIRCNGERCLRFIYHLPLRFTSELRNRVSRRYQGSRTEALKTVKIEAEIEVSFVVQGCVRGAAFVHTFSVGRYSHREHATAIRDCVIIYRVIPSGTIKREGRQ